MSQRHLAANTNRSEEGGSGCRKVNSLVNKCYNVMSLRHVYLLVTVPTYELFKSIETVCRLIKSRPICTECL